MSEPAEPLLDVRGVTLQYRTSQRIVTATHRVSFAVFPGDLPANPDDLFAPGAAPFRGLSAVGGTGVGDFRFVRFRPPPLQETPDGAPSLPHIRLDRALQFLIGDRLT